MASNSIKRDHHTWTRDTVKNVSGDVTLDIVGDITLDADGGDIRFKDNDTNQLSFSNSSGTWTILSATSDADMIFKVNDGGANTEVMRLDGSESSLLIAGDCIIDRDTTLTADGTAKGLHIDYDHTGISASGQTVTGIGLDLDMNCESVTHVGTVNQTGIDLDMTAAADGTQSNVGINVALSGSDTCTGLSIDTTVAASGTCAGIYLDNKNGGKDFQNVSSADSTDYFMINTIAAGATTLSTVDNSAAAAHLTLDIDGHVEFDGCAVGFDREEETFSGDDLLASGSGTGGTHDTHIDFRIGNKIYLQQAASMDQINLIFPNTSGNFLLYIRYDGDWSIGDWKVWASDLTAPSITDVQWPGGTQPDNTASGRDIFSFYWDYDTETCFGVASLAFAVPS